jgi:hypothetical protein
MKTFTAIALLPFYLLVGLVFVVSLESTTVFNAYKKGR